MTGNMDETKVIPKSVIKESLKPLLDDEPAEVTAEKTDEIPETSEVVSADIEEVKEEISEVKKPVENSLTDGEIDEVIVEQLVEGDLMKSEVEEKIVAPVKPKKKKKKKKSKTGLHVLIVFLAFVLIFLLSFIVAYKIFTIPADNEVEKIPAAEEKSEPNLPDKEIFYEDIIEEEVSPDDTTVENEEDPELQTEEEDPAEAVEETDKKPVNKTDKKPENKTEEKEAETEKPNPPTPQTSKPSGNSKPQVKEPEVVEKESSEGLIFE